MDAPEYEGPQYTQALLGGDQDYVFLSCGDCGSTVTVRKVESHTEWHKLLFAALMKCPGINPGVKD